MSDPNYRPTGIERAYELARSGRFKNIEHLTKALNSEGYGAAATLSGRLLRRELVALLKAAKAGGAG